MPDLVGLRIELEDTKEVWSRVTEFEIEESFFVDADKWSATVYSPGDPRELRRKFLPKRQVNLYLGDRLQLMGRIEETTGMRGGSTALRIEGMDYLADLVAPNIDPSFVVLNTMTLEQALLAGLAAFGITEIETTIKEVRTKKMGVVTKEVVNPIGDVAKAQAAANTNVFGLEGLTNGLAVFNPDTLAIIPVAGVTRVKVEKMPDASPNNGEGALQWAQRLAARAGYTVQPGTKRSAIAVVEPDFAQSPFFNLSRPGNVEDAAASRNWSGVPTHVASRSRRLAEKSKVAAMSRNISIFGGDSPLAFGNLDETKRVVAASNAVSGRVDTKTTGDASRWYCPIYYKDDDAKTESQLQRSSRRTFADRLRSTLEYQCDLKGHVDPATGATYAVNVLANVVDAVEDVNEVLWIAERRLSYAPGQGERTSLTLIRPASYEL